MLSPYYKAIRKAAFRPERDAFVCDVAELVKRTVDATGGAVTVRQVYYQAVNAGLVQSGDQGYQRIQDAIKDGREVGRIAWNVIEDRGRSPRKPYHESGVVEALADLARGYRLDRAAGQRFRVEVWLEQAALREIVWPICAELGAVLVVCGGFTSHDSLFKASERFRGYDVLGQQPIMLHLSDLDPSGVQMGAVIGRKIELLLDDSDEPDAECEVDFDALDEGCATSAGRLYVQRIGLTIAQAKQHGLLARPLKDGDSRAPAYREQHGNFAYELDGLPPWALQSIVRTAIEPLIDWAARDQVLAQERTDQRIIEELIKLGRSEGLLP
jgi:hypothetical protein